MLVPKHHNLVNLLKNHENIDLVDLGIQKWKLPCDGRGAFQKFCATVLRRLLNILLDYPNIEYYFKVRRQLKKIKGFHALISVASPHSIHWGVASVWNNNLAHKWIADCGDPYALLKSDTINKLFYFRYIEKWFMNKTDYITVPLNEAKKAYFKEFHHKIRIIPQGLCFPKLANKNNNDSTVEPVKFAYLGNVRSYQHYAIPFLKTLKDIKTSYQFTVYTNHTDFFLSKIDKTQLQYCSIHHYQDRMSVLEAVCDIDFFIFFPYKDNTQLPFKLIDYNFLDKPVLSFKNDVKSKKTFFEFLNRDFKNRMELPSLDIYKIEKVAEQFTKLIEFQ